MGDIINLNKARKARQKDEKKAAAAQNRVIYGISTRDRQAGIEKERTEVRKLDQLRLEKNDGNKKS